MPEIGPVGHSSKINMLIHADIGWGKTTLIGTGGQKFKILLIRPPIEHTDPIIGSGVQEMIVRNWEEAFEGLELVQHTGHEWDWVWLDNISLFQDIGLDDVYTGVLDRKGEVGSAARKAREQFGPDQGEYGVNMWRLGQWVRYMVGAGVVNLGITAHSFWYEPKAGSRDDASGFIQPCLWPWIQGKNMPSKMCGMMNLVAYGDLQTREVRGRTITSRTLRTNKTENYYAKCQFKLPDAAGGFSPNGPSVFGDGRIVNPTLPGMVEEIMKGRIVTPRGQVSPVQARRPVRRRTRRST